MTRRFCIFGFFRRRHESETRKKSRQAQQDGSHNIAFDRRVGEQSKEE